jgi:hypothetical protein
VGGLWGIDLARLMELMIRSFLLLLLEMRERMLVMVLLGVLTALC